MSHRIISVVFMFFVFLLTACGESTEKRGARMEFNRDITFIKAGNLSIEEGTRKLAKKHGFPAEKIDVAVIEGAKILFERDLRSLAEGYYSRESDLRKIAKRHSLPEERIDTALKGCYEALLDQMKSGRIYLVEDVRNLASKLGKPQRAVDAVAETGLKAAIGNSMKSKRELDKELQEWRDGVKGTCTPLYRNDDYMSSNVPHLTNMGATFEEIAEAMFEGHLKQISAGEIAVHGRYEHHLAAEYFVREFNASGERLEKVLNTGRKATFKKLIALVKEGDAWAIKTARNLVEEQGLPAEELEKAIVEWEKFLEVDGPINEYKYYINSLMTGRFQPRVADQEKLDNIYETQARMIALKYDLPTEEIEIAAEAARKRRLEKK